MPICTGMLLTVATCSKKGAIVLTHFCNVGTTVGQRAGSLVAPANPVMISSVGLARSITRRAILPGRACGFFFGPIKCTRHTLICCKPPETFGESSAIATETVADFRRRSSFARPEYVRLRTSREHAPDAFALTRRRGILSAKARLVATSDALATSPNQCIAAIAVGHSTKQGEEIAKRVNEKSRPA